MDDPVVERLRRAVTACLRNVHELVNVWFADLSTIQGYQAGLISAETIRAECTLVFNRLLGEIGDLQIAPEAQSISTRVGHSRALRGIPLSDLLTAVRLDYRVLWNALITEIGADDAEVLVAIVPRLLDAVERHSHEVAKAYNLTQHGLVQARQDERRLWFTRLIETDGRNQVLNLRACEVLSLRQDHPFMVFVHTRRSEHSLRTLKSELDRRHINAHLYEVEEGEILLTQLTDSERISLSSWMRQVGSLAAIGPFTGVALVPSAVRLLFTLSANLADPDPGFNRLEDHWPLASLHAPEEASRLLRRRYLSALLELPSPERRILIETADSYLSTGSIAETSRALFCHRNTTAGRLDQIERLSSLDLRRPKDASVFLLAYASVESALQSRIHT